MPDTVDGIEQKPRAETPIENTLALRRLSARRSKITAWRATRVERIWAGLRTFAPDRTPVAGFDPAAEGFFRLAAQGAAEAGGAAETGSEALAPRRRRKQADLGHTGILARLRNYFFAGILVCKRRRSQRR